MKIFISGGTGFVGTYLCRHLLDKGHGIIAAGTSKRHICEGRDGFELISCNTSLKGKWQESLKDVDAVINLAGRNIFRLWTKKYKSLMYDSRVLTTRNLINALPGDRKITFLSTSAAGCYGNRGDEILNEKSLPGTGFLAHLCEDWERQAFKGEEKGAKVSIMRFGVVLGKNGGTLAQMIPAFKCFAGGPLGNGKQWFPWIHIKDLASAVEFLLEEREGKGVLNFSAPVPVRQKDFAKALGKVMNRPSVIPAPGFILRLIMGELGSALLESQRVVPEKLMEEGFVFKYKEVHQALDNIIRQ